METRTGALPPGRPARAGLGDIMAAVALVAAGHASRIVLSAFPDWPELVEAASGFATDVGVAVLPAVLSPGGRVDIVVVPCGDD